MESIINHRFLSLREYLIKIKVEYKSKRQFSGELDICINECFYPLEHVILFNSNLNTKLPN